MQKKLLTVAVAVLLISVTGASALASASERTAASEAKPTKMRMSVSAERFLLEGGHVYARGPIALRTAGGETAYRTRQRIDLSLRKEGGTCKVLDLHLAKLFVALLGLEVTTSEVNLEITGDDRKALGRLFCQLSKGLHLNKRELTLKAVHSLNQRLDSHPMRLLRINATLHPQTYEAAAARAPGDGGPRCQILDVDIGPLQLDLLGLVVDLYGATKKSPVHVDADADPNGGAVGAALCQVSSGPA
jgi:hypothetical protein